MAESFLSQLRNSPEVKGLIQNAGSFAAARAAQGFAKDAPAPVAGAVSEVAEKVQGGEKVTPFTAIKGAIKGIFKGKGGAKRPTNIYEQNFIGVPVDFAYAAWKEYAEFPKFMKGPESVSEEDEEGKSKWTAKIFLNRRSWTATVVEDIENYKIRWESEAPKGTVDGTVTFHEVSEYLTLMVYVLEYRPKGFFERIGNLNRVVGRRARLDAKHFVRYVMMQNFEDDGASRLTEEEPDERERDEQAEEQGEAEHPDEESAGGDEEVEDETESEQVGEFEEPPAPRSPRTPREPRSPRQPR